MTKKNISKMEYNIYALNFGTLSRAGCMAFISTTSPEKACSMLENHLGEKYLKGYEKELLVIDTKLKTNQEKIIYEGSQDFINNSLAYKWSSDVHTIKDLKP